jgi:hypothetical protein
LLNDSGIRLTLAGARQKIITSGREIDAKSAKNKAGNTD